MLLTQRWPKYLLAAALVFWVMVNVATLTSYPIPTCDEAFYTRTSTQYIQQQSWPEISGTFFYLPYGRVYWVLLGLFQQFVPGPLFAGRFLSFLSLWLTALATYWLVKRYTHNGVMAIWAGALVAFSWLGFFIGHRIRPNIFATTMSVLMLIALQWALSNMQRRSAAVFGSSLLTPLLFHSVGIYLSIAAAVWYIVASMRRKSWSSLAVFVAAALVTSLLIAYVRLGAALPIVLSTAWTDPLGFIAGYVSASGAQTQLLSPVKWFAGFWWNYYFWFATPLSPIQGVFFLFGLGYSLLSRSSPFFNMAWIIILSTVPFAIVNADFTAPPEYGFLWLPLYTVLAVYALVDWVRKSEHVSSRVPQIVFGSLLALYIAGDAYLLIRERADTYRRAADEMTQIIEADHSLLAASFWWYHLSDHTQFVDETILAPQGSILWWNAVPNAPTSDAPEPNLDITSVDASLLEAVAQAALNEIQPDYILDDQRIGCATDASPISQTVTRYAQQHCEPVGLVEQLVSNDIERYYGEQVIYDCRPNSPDME